MERIDREKAYQLLIAKEQDYEDLVRTFKKEKQALEEQLQSLDMRRRMVEQIVDEEVAKMGSFLRSRGDTVDSEIQSSFYNAMSLMNQQSEDGYFQAYARLERQLEDIEDQYRKNRYQLDDEIEEARKQYVRSH
ncbi:hypothetical protein ACVRYP_08405 [Streptococcus rifensis]